VSGSPSAWPAKVIEGGRRRTSPSATELDSEPECEALAQSAGEQAGRRCRPRHPAPLASPGVRDADLRRGEQLPRRLSPERLRRAACVAALALLALSAGPALAAKHGGSHRFDWHQRVRDASRFLAGRTGSASFAVVDEHGRVHGHRARVQYSSASLVKAMLLVAYLDRRQVRRRHLHHGERALLGPMVRLSDNDAASAIYDRVGEQGLSRLAHRAGMRRFVPYPVWGGCQVTARDQARFFFRIRALLPPRHRSYALGLLRRIVSYERWGIPRAAPAGWRTYFKGGWFPDDDGWRVHQAALLRDGRRRLSIAVLTRGSPSLGYGAATIAGVTQRLLRGYR
jgi:beta-lactamase family protein